MRGLMERAREIVGFPRHLSQHVGGFVIARGRLDELVPIQNAAMADRTVVEWDKDDLDALGILKIDVLALGMLSCLRAKPMTCMTHILRPAADLATTPAEDPRTYRHDLAGRHGRRVPDREPRADEHAAAAQAACFYDLVIEVAIVRPGPIQGDMVHPYLRRRQGRGTGHVSQRRQLRGGAGEDARRAALPGAGDADRHCGGGLHAGRGRQAAPRDGDLPAVGTIDSFTAR
jgi:DNA polymerase III alpha subunit